ncbi:beta-xylosidase [Ilyomonas limi]|uniref:Beta-xylosidase n=1 Tax=Ilyomonas limi TaxID=2575867 RepID=A0A4U3KZ69_9BACT|nr:glycoside hydrolase family 43 protein [Ilyomonas limi]TKK67732.1 beta-xylosidase [Ilyomonas limi]
MKISIKYLFIFPFLLCSLFVVLSCSSIRKNTTALQKQSAGNLLYQADPTIFYDKGQYYLYGTNGGNADSGFKVFISKDLKSWQLSNKNNGWALVKGNAFGTKGFWAPQVFLYRGKYYMAYTANEQIAIAQSNNPEGPFTQKIIRPIDTTIKEIDPFVFIDTDGKIYLYHVRLQNGNRIFVAQLNDSLSAIIPNTVQECISAVNNPQPWENTKSVSWTVTEGPCVIKRKDDYCMFYSANDFRNPDYAVGYATANSPIGPWTKYSGNPIISRQLSGIKGTGHGDILKDEKDDWWYVLHTHYSDSVVGPRKTAIVQFRFNSTNNVVIDTSSFRYLKM